MKLTIVEKVNKEEIKNKDAYWDRPSTPLTYRVSIKLLEDEILLTREYFFVGYLSGEQPDVFYFNDDNAWNNSYLNYATFITRTFNEDYLNEKEQELIDKFFNKLILTDNKIKKDYAESIKNFEEKIKLYKKYQNSELFTKINRKLKLENINK